MDEHHLRNRIGFPLLMVLLLLGGIALVLFSVSRVLLTLSSGAAVLIAFLIAGFVLLIASTLGQNRQVSGRALGVALVVGLLGLMGAGIAAHQIGPREIEAHSGESGGEAGAEGGAEGGSESGSESGGESGGGDGSGEGSGGGSGSGEGSGEGEGSGQSGAASGEQTAGAGAGVVAA